MEIYKLNDKIEKLRKQRGWSVYKLAEEAEITPSTIFNMYSRGTLPSITTLYALCNAFEISLAEFFSDDNRDELNDAERELVKKFRKMSYRNKKALLTCADALTEPESTNE